MDVRRQRISSTEPKVLRPQASTEMTGEDYGVARVASAGCLAPTNLAAGRRGSDTDSTPRTHVSLDLGFVHMEELQDVWGLQTPDTASFPLGLDEGAEKPEVPDITCTRVPTMAPNASMRDLVAEQPSCLLQPSRPSRPRSGPRQPAGWVPCKGQPRPQPQSRSGAAGPQRCRESTSEPRASSPAAAPEGPSLHLRADGWVLFDMLDRDQDELLSRQESRVWFRALGWCLSDEDLDAILDEVLAEAPQQAAGLLHDCIPPDPNLPGGALCGRRWSHRALQAAAGRYFSVCGPDPKALTDALFALLGPRRAVSTGFLRDRLALGDGLPEADFAQLLALCGLPSQGSVSLEALLGTMVEAICQPNTALERGGGRNVAPLFGVTARSGPSRPRQ